MFICPTCNKSFKSQLSVYAHSQIHNSSNLISKRNKMLQIHATRRIRTEQNAADYNMCPSTCTQCCTPLEYKKRTNKFCSLSCSASYNNSSKGRKQPKPKPSIFTKGVQYTRVRYQQCSNCHNNFWSHSLPNQHLPTTCSDKCFISIKRKNASGNKKITYKNITFDSGWEVEMAMLLDHTNINWVIPQQSIIWIDSTGKQRKYFPDFYLPRYDIYLDPKNPLVIKRQQEKLDAVTKIITLFYGKPSDILVRLGGLEPTCIH